MNENQDDDSKVGKIRDLYHDLDCRCGFWARNLSWPSSLWALVITYNPDMDAFISNMYWGRNMVKKGYPLKDSGLFIFGKIYDSWDKQSTEGGKFDESMLKENHEKNTRS